MIADDPVRITVSTAPALVVAVEADAGALDPRAGALHVRVKLAARCGGSFAGTSGIVAIDAVPAQPAPSTAYRSETSATPSAPAGTYKVCVFLDDDEGRQWATDVDSELVVGGGTPPGTSGGCVALTRPPAKVTGGA